MTEFAIQALANSKEKPEGVCPFGSCIAPFIIDSAPNKYATILMEI